MATFRFRNSAALLLLLFVMPWPHDPCWAAQRSEDPFTRGVAYFRQGDFSTALAAFEEAVKGERFADGEAYYYLGLTQAGLERNEEAILSLERAGELAPDLAGVHLNLGITYYKLQSYEPALMELNRALEENPESGSVHFFIGLTKQSKGLYQNSIPFFQKAMSLDPDLTQSAWYHLGLAYYREGRRGEGERAFKEALKPDPESETARDAKRLIETMKAPERESKRWWVKAETGLEYDDNLAVEEADIVSDEQDWAAVFEVGGSFRFLDRHPCEGKIGYDFYQSLYNEVSRFDLQSHALDISGERDLGMWDGVFDYVYTNMYLGGDGFLETQRITPSLGLSLKPYLYLTVVYAYQDKEFREEENNPRDGGNHSVGFDLFFFFMKNRAYAQAGYRLEEENTSGDEFEYTGHGVRASVQVPAPFQSRMRFGYRYHQKDYENITPSIGSQREDTRQTFDLAWSYNISKKMGLKLDYRYIDRDSNLSSIEYTENIFFIGLSVAF